MTLLFHGCEATEQREIARLVALDLTGSESPSRPSVGSIHLTCHGGRFDIAIERTPARTFARSVDLRQLPERARPRMVAIALVELLAADTKPDATAEPAVDDARPRGTDELGGPGADTSPPSAPATPCCRLQLAAVGATRTFLGGVAGLLGGGVRGEAASGLLGFDALAELGTSRTNEGVVHVASLSSSLSAGWSTPPAYSTLRLAGGARFGLARLSGQPSNPAQWSGLTGWRGWAGPKLEAGLTLHPSRRALVELDLEVGYTLFSLYGLAAQQRRLGLNGVWVGLQLGVGVGL